MNAKGKGEAFRKDGLFYEEKCFLALGSINLGTLY